MGYDKLTINEMHRLSVDEYRQADKMPIEVILDNVRSRHNIGSVFRTSDAFRIAKIHLCGICSTPPDADIHKTALGAEDSVAWEHHEDTLALVTSLQQRGYKVYAVEQAHGSTMLQDFMPEQYPIAVIFGHEVYGVQQQVVNACDGCIEIPQYGTKHSLNVSVTAGIVLHALTGSLKPQP